MNEKRCSFLCVALVALLLLSESSPSSAQDAVLSQAVQQQRQPADGGGRPCCFYNRKLGVQMKKTRGRLVPGIRPKTRSSATRKQVSQLQLCSLLGTFTPQTRGHELMMLEKQLKNHENDRNIREGNEQSHGGLHETLHAKRGGYGGSDIVRRPTKSRSASSSLPVNPFSAFSTTLWHVSIGLLVFIFFF
ncbi:hypothetical protein F0562_009276 [Nyssa sinensis]|uniref:Uncharacterized protein n=1 Tax=Nyssa sinensis TaxID=561372 RepID=A0A5J4ZVI8_9ASTE|nr:hypothetical protein F0562_009276 [Nyssa sinensis]